MSSACTAEADAIGAAGEGAERGPTQCLSASSHPGDDFELVATREKRKFGVDDENAEEVQRLLTDIKLRRRGVDTICKDSRTPRPHAGRKKKDATRKTEVDDQPAMDAAAANTGSAYPRSHQTKPSCSAKKARDVSDGGLGTKPDDKAGECQGKKRAERAIVVGRARKKTPLAPTVYTPAVDLELNGGGVASLASGMNKYLIIHRFEYESKRGGSKVNRSGQRALAIFVQSRSSVKVPP